MMNFLSPRTLLSLLLISLSSLLAAVNEQSANRINGTAIAASATVSASDNKYAYMVANPSSWQTNSFSIHRGVGRIMLGIDPNCLTYVSGTYTAKVTVNLTYYISSALTTPVAYSTPVVLQVNYDASAAADQQDRAVFELGAPTISGDIVKMSASVSSITDASNTPITAAANLYLDISTDVERYYNMDLTNYPAASILMVTTNSSTGNIDLAWNSIAGAESYDIEWTWVNNYDPTSSTGGVLGTTPSNALVLDFAHNSTRVNVSGNNFSFPNIFDKGFVGIRIRAVGYALDGSTWKTVAGRWSSEATSTPVAVGALRTATAFTGYAGGHVVDITTAYTPKMNWQYQATYAEEGKKKEVVSYFDGSLRNRQTVTKTSTDKKVLVGETIYDYEGRGAISILPAPVTGSNMPIAYQFAFNRNSGGTVAYSKADFDADAGTCATSTGSLSSTTGSSNYYSSSNAYQTNWQGYLPDAGGYPLVQTELTPDNTGRVRKQGGAGSTHQLSGGHATQSFYAQPLQEELDRLFGAQVGYKKHYNKTMTIDPNGQTSVTYVDQMGRTIATGLAGDTATLPVMALREGGSGTLSSSYHQLNNITVDLLAKDNATDVDDDQDDNILSSTGDALTLSTQLLVANRQLYTFNYDLDGFQYTEECLENICYTCSYDLTIDIVDQCGVRPTVQGGSSAIPYTASRLGINDESFTCGTDNLAKLHLTGTPAPISIMLDPGSYTVIKRLTINQDALAEALANYITQSNCVIQESTMIDAAVAEVDTTQCHQTSCTDCATYQSPCEASYQMMLGDVSPGAQYAEYRDNSGNLNTAMYPLSVFNTSNMLPKYNATWKNPKHANGNAKYYDADGTTESLIALIPNPNTSNYIPAVVNATTTGTNPLIFTGGIYYTTAQNLTNVEDFVFYWKPSWAASLVSYHPEYCYYEWCKGNGEIQSGHTLSSDDWDEDMLSADTKTAAAGNSPSLLNPLGNASGTPAQSNCQDPYFKTGGKGASDYTAMNTRMLNYSNNFSIWQMAKLMSTCGTLYNASAATMDACVGNPGANDSTWYITSDTEWKNFRMLYLALKQEFQQKRADENAISCDGYNGCIGTTTYNPAAEGMITNAPYFTSSEFFDNTNSSTTTRQPCCDLTFWMYAGKVKRFVDAIDATATVTTSSTVADQNYYLMTGQCPEARDLQSLLSKLAANNQLKATSLSLQTYPEFTNDLYCRLFASCTTNVVINYTGTQSSAAILSMAFAGTGTSCSTATTLEFISTTYSWSNYNSTFRITGFSNLQTDGGTGYTVTAHIDHDTNSATADVLELMRGSQGCFSLSCSFSTVCTANNTVPDAVMLMNMLRANRVMGTTGVNLSSTGTSPYAAMFNSSTLDNYFTCGSNYTWDSVTTATTTYRLLCNSNASGNGLEFVFNATLPASLEYFSNPVLLDATTLQLTCNLTGGSTSLCTLSVFTFTSGSPGAKITLGSCGNPEPQACAGSDYQRRADLEALLTAKKTALTDAGTAVSLMSETAFTTLLQTMGSGSYTWSAPGGNNTTSPVDITIANGSNTCTLHLEFAGTPGVNQHFENISSFGPLVADELNLVNGQAYNFTIVAWFGTNGGDGSALLKGSSCYVIKNCPVCESYATSTYENFDVATSATGSGLTQTSSGACPSSTGQYVLTNSAATTCSDNTILGADHNNPGSGKYIYANIAASSSVKVWEDTITVVAQKPYTFNCWYLDPTAGLNTGGATCSVELLINGSVVKTEAVSELNPGTWRQVRYDWPGSTTTACTLAVRVVTNSTASWKLAIDDISFYTPGCYPLMTLQETPEFSYNPPCAGNLINIATLNAQQQYEQYIDSISAQFTANYINHCMSTVIEQFKVTYDITEYQFTLYYYDQAGNLTRTIPPAGVRIVDLTADANSNSILNGQEIKNNRSARTATPSSAQTFFTTHIMATTYTYNSLNQLVEQTTPDGGTSKFWYDKLGRIVASQNAKQANMATQGWSYTVFDALGRISEVGELYTNTDLKTMSASTLYSTLNASNYPDNWAGAASTTARADVTKTYYDSEQSSFGVAARFTAGYQKNLRKRVAHAAVYDSYNGTNTAYTSATHYSYDIHGNVEELIQEIPELATLNDATAGVYQSYKNVQYVYDLISGSVKQVKYQHNQPDRFYHKYEYDADNRVVAAFTSTDNLMYDRDAKYMYYQHGPLARTEIGNETVQAMDYAYTIQGWIKGVNGNAGTTSTDMGRDGNNSGAHQYVAPDEMGYSLSYFDGDYTSTSTNAAIASITGSGLDAASPDLYNGNIRHMITTIKKFSTANGYDGEIQAMAYKYDQLNRIRSSEQYTNYNSGTNSWSSGGSGNTAYKENFVYDHNGNILKLKRNAKAGTTALDDLKYYYYNQAGTSTYDPMSSTPTDASNKLAYVTDAVSSSYSDDIDNQSSGNYTYDKIGQLISDAQEGINTIAWTVYNKIRSVTRSSGSTKTDLEFKYDAMGNRILKIAKPRTAGGAASTQEAWTYTYYLRDAQGNVMATYERSFPKASSTYEDKIKVKEQHIYGSSRVGIHTKDLQLTSKSYNFTSYSGVYLQGTYVSQSTASASNVNYTHTIGKKSYELSNHLGNVLVAVSDARVPTNSSGTVTAYAAVLKAATDYSAFGAPMENRTWSSASYRYGFNGKEKENELHGNVGDTYDFGARIYDARLGRWLACDPLEKKYPHLSTYGFVGNSPFVFVDKDGKDLYLTTDGTAPQNAARTQMMSYFQTNAKGVSVAIRNNGRVRVRITDRSAMNPLAEALYESARRGTPVLRLQTENNIQISETVDEKRVRPGYQGMENQIDQKDPNDPKYDTYDNVPVVHNYGVLFATSNNASASGADLRVDVSDLTSTTLSKEFQTSVFIGILLNKQSSVAKTILPKVYLKSALGPTMSNTDVLNIQNSTDEFIKKIETTDELESNTSKRFDIGKFVFQISATGGNPTREDSAIKIE